MLLILRYNYKKFGFFIVLFNLKMHKFFQFFMQDSENTVIPTTGSVLHCMKLVQLKQAKIKYLYMKLMCLFTQFSGSI